jgi:hypothetical protein
MKNVIGFVVVFLAVHAGAQDANKLERIGFVFGGGAPVRPHVIEDTNSWPYRMVDGRINNVHLATNWYSIGGMVKQVGPGYLMVEGFFGDGNDAISSLFVLRNFSNQVSHLAVRGERLPGSFKVKLVGETNLTSAVLGTRTLKVFDYGRPVSKPTVSARP